MLKKHIVEYFDSVVREIDFFTELKIQQDVSLEEVWNKRRDVQIKTVQQLQTASLTKADKFDDESQLEKALDEFCFTVEFNSLLFVIKVNRYVGPNEINLFKSLLEWKKLTAQQRINLITDGKEVFLSKSLYDVWLTDLCPAIETELLQKLCKSDIPILDMNSWFDLDSSIKITISNCKAKSSTIDKDLKSTNLLRIGAVELSLYVESLEQSKEAVVLINTVSNYFEKAENIVVNLSFPDPKLVEFVETYKSDQRISFTGQSSLDKTNQCEQLSKLIWLKKIRAFMIINPLIDPKIDWSHIEDLKLSRVTFKDLNSTTFQGLRSLKELTLSFNNFISLKNDWSFLDPLRANLEYFDLSRNEMPFMSSKIFSGMTNLTELIVKGLDSYELDCKHVELFVDLIRLENLTVTFPIHFFLSEGRLELVNLKNLSLGCSMDDRPFPSDLEIKVDLIIPNLKSLELDLDRIEGFKGIEKLFAHLSHVEHLHLSSSSVNALKCNYLKEFKSLKRLEIQPESTSSRLILDSQMLIDLESLVELQLYFNLEIKPNAFQNLTNLEYLHVSNFDEDVIKNTELFDGLVSLNRMFYSCPAPLFDQVPKLSNSFVYFKNLNKFVLVSKNFNKNNLD